MLRGGPHLRHDLFLSAPAGFWSANRGSWPALVVWIPPVAAPPEGNRHLVSGTVGAGWRVSSALDEAEANDQHRVS